MLRLLCLKIAFIALFVSKPAAAQEADDWLRDTSGLKGNVRSVYHTSNFYYGGEQGESGSSSFDYNEQGFLFRENMSDDYSRDGSYTCYRIYDSTGMHCLAEYDIYGEDTSSRYEYTYDQHGQLEQAKRINKGGEHWSTWNYTYNDKGQLMTSFGSLTQVNQKWHHTFEYDEKGRITRNIAISPNRSVVRIMTYDENGFLTEEQYLDSNRAPKTVIKHDSEGNETSREITTYWDDPYTKDSYVAKFVYNENGQVSKKTTTEPDGSNKWEDTFTYNDHGDLTSITAYSIEMNFTRQLTMAYVYDDKGNWIEKVTVYDEDMTRVERRVLVYY